MDRDGSVLGEAVPGGREAERLATRPPAPFVVGIARSGTTLLRLQLDSHPELAIPPETGIGPMLAQLCAGIEPRDLLDAMLALPTWPDFRMRPEFLAAEFAQIPGWSPGEGLRAFYRAYAARHRKSRWGDKTPVHVAHMDTLANFLPEARFIHLIRDGRDVAASMRGLPFAPGDGSIEATAVAWRDGIAKAQWVGSTLPHYREVRYERLVAEPEATLRELCDFIELPFDDSMLRAHERALERLDELFYVRVADDGTLYHVIERRPIGVNVQRPPDPTRTGRWRVTLSANEIARFEGLAGSALAALGYELSSAPRPRNRRGTNSARPSAGRSSPIRVLLGSHSFAAPGGTESYVFTVARELQRLGHEAIITTEESGPMGDFAERSGVPVARLATELPSECDVVFAHDAIMAAALAERYPDTRLVYFAHSDLHDHQLPPLLPDLVETVVVASDRVAARIRALACDVPIVRLRHPIDTETFAPSGPIRDRPRRALLLSNYLRGERRRALVNAWEEAGVECAQIGEVTKTELDVVPAIGEADIVVAKARAALEAMSCARAVYIYDEFGGDGWVTSGNYAALEADNFAGQATGGPRTPDDLAADLADYRPDMGWANRELIRTHHGARKHAAQLVEFLRSSTPNQAARATTVLGEISRLNRSRMHAERQVEIWRRRAAEAQRQLQLANEQLATRRVRFGIALGRTLDRVRGRG